MGKPLSEDFMKELLRGGKYSAIIQRVLEDKDLNIEFRESTRTKQSRVDVYFKGHPVLGLYGTGRLEKVDKAFAVRGIPTKLDTAAQVNEYLDLLPAIKDRVSRHPARGLEIEYEQLIIRANNRERRNTSAEYIIVDRQYDCQRTGRWDLVAIKWPLPHRDTTGYLSLIEVKYSLAGGIAKLPDQVEKYWKYMRDNFDRICTEMEGILHQKVKLGLIERSEDQKQHLEKLSLDRNYESAEVIVCLLDYNPNSTDRETAREGFRRLESEGRLPRGQIWIVNGGSAIWHQNLEHPYLRIVWREWERSPATSSLGHGIEFHDSRRPPGDTMVAWLEGFDWLYRRPEQIVIDCIKADPVTTKQAIDAMKNRVERIVMRGDTPTGIITTRITAIVNG